MSNKQGTFFIETLLSDDERAISLRAVAKYVSPDQCFDLTFEGLVGVLRQKKLDHYKIHTEQLEEISKALLEAAEQIESEEDTVGLSLETDPIAEAVDAIGEVEVTEDKLEARLSITPAQGGDSMTYEKSLELLEEAGVTYGVKEKELRDLLAKAADKSYVENCTALVAEALMPVKGEDAQFIPLVDTANERILKPKLKEDGTVDMRDLGDIPTVKEGDPLMRKEPPTPGEKGINVFSEEIAAEPGNDLEFKPGKGSRISADDNLILEAAISGQPNLQKRGMKVDDAVKVTAVDLSTGHMTLDANLIVKGDISEGMKVRCEGDITVGGVIESADVKAKGNIIIGKGILGRTPESLSGEPKFTASVRAGGTVSAMFASYSEIIADKEVLMAEQLLHCRTVAGEKVIVGNQKTVGSQIVGGVTTAGHYVEADIIGASAGVRTLIDMSGSFDTKSYELSATRTIIEEKQKMLKNMSDAYSKFMSIQLTEERKVHAQKIKNTVTHLEQEIRELESQYDQIKEERSKLCEGSSVRAKRKFQQNVEFKIGHHKLKLTREREAGLLVYDDGELKYRSANAEEK